MKRLVFALLCLGIFSSCGTSTPEAQYQNGTTSSSSITPSGGGTGSTSTTPILSPKLVYRRSYGGGLNLPGTVYQTAVEFDSLGGIYATYSDKSRKKIAQVEGGLAQSIYIMVDAISTAAKYELVATSTAVVCDAPYDEYLFYQSTKIRTAYRANCGADQGLVLKAGETVDSNKQDVAYIASVVRNLVRSHQDAIRLINSP